MPSKQLTNSQELSPATGPPRLTRKRRKDHHYAPGKHRKALSTLIKETSSRCAYSLQHIDDIGGISSLEVDHFNPTLVGKRRNFHGNLIPAARLCNNTKSNHWPNDAERSKGIRYLNPYEEADYGTHLFEDRSTGLIHGQTPAGKWHILKLGLNAEHLVRARLRRTQIISKFTEAVGISGADSKNEMISKVMENFADVSREILDVAIPKLPSLSDIQKPE
jgi:5-methylcytosine-specific restriction endonuclease McrA